MEVAFCIQGRGPDAVRGSGGKAPEAKQVLPASSGFDIKCTHYNVSKLNQCTQ